jgi:hypothetical protein
MTAAVRSATILLGVETGERVDLRLGRTADTLTAWPHDHPSGATSGPPAHPGSPPARRRGVGEESLQRGRFRLGFMVAKAVAQDRREGAKIGHRLAQVRP